MRRTNNRDRPLPSEIAAVLLWVAAFVLMSACAATPAAGEGFEIHAHRGGRGLWPENTLAAFRNAIEMGITTLELDLAVTKDRILVVSHDPRLTGTLVKGPSGSFLDPEKEIRINELTYADLQTYTVGEINRRSDYYYRFRGQTAIPGQTIPSLEDLFLMTREMSEKTNIEISFNLEIKVYPPFPEYTVDRHEFVTLLLDIIDKWEYQNRVVIQSFDWNALALVQRIEPDIAVACLAVSSFAIDGEPYNLLRGRPGPSPWLGGIDIDDFENVPAAVHAFGASIYSPYHRELTETDVVEAHRLGLRVLPWTVNDESTMRRLIAWGVDGIITDRPDILMEIRERQSP